MKDEDEGMLSERYPSPDEAKFLSFSEISLALVGPKGVHSKPTEIGSITIQLEYNVKKIVNDARIEASDRWQAATSRSFGSVAARVGNANDIVQTSGAGASGPQPFDAFLPNLKAVVDAVDRFAEVR